MKRKTSRQSFAAGDRQKTRVKTARGRKTSSTRWLARQLNDPYVKAAQRDGYRSRAAYKLREIDDRFGFLARGACVVDLGCAPGGWCQVAVQRCGGSVIGVDLADMESLAGVAFLKLDFMAAAAPARIMDLAGCAPDVVLSDMAAAVTGHKRTDHWRTMGLAEAAADFAFSHLREGGVFCAKVFQGGTEAGLLRALKARFERCVHMKPDASRKDSVELYVIAIGFKG